MQILLSLLLLTAPAQANETATFVTDCYRDYVNAWSEQPAEAKLEAVRERCLSAGFKRDWKRLVKKTDADAFLLAQDTADVWKTTDPMVAVLNKKVSKAKVVLGMASSQEQCLLLKLVKENDAPKIDTVKACAKE